MPLTLIDRRVARLAGRTSMLPGHNNDADYLKHYEGRDDPLDNNTSKLTQKIFWSAVRSRKNTNEMQQSINSFKNKSTISGNLSILSAAMAMSSSEYLSSRMSSRLSMQSKKRLVAMHSVEKRKEYADLYEDIKVNKLKIQQDLKWLEEQVARLQAKESRLRYLKISRSSFYLYGGSLIAHQQDLIVHSYFYAYLNHISGFTHL